MKMESADFVRAVYEYGNSIEIQGKQKDIEKYTNNGYYVKESRNGYWVLVKPCRVMVRLLGAGKVQDFNMKQDICSLYDKQRISQKTFDKFFEDADKGNIEFQVGDGCYSMKKK